MIALAPLLALAWPAASLPDPESDLTAARVLFERNVSAIQERDRDGYLACYLPEEGLVRAGPAGFQRGFAGLAEGTPADGSDEWPDELVAGDLRLAWLAEGWVYGTYRYRVTYDGEVAEGLSERLFRRTTDGWRIVVTTAFGAPAGTPPPPVALVGARVHDGAGATVEDAVIVVRDGRFDAVGPRATTPVPDGVDVVDLAGRTVVPGLIDTHVHYSQTGWADGRPDAADVRDEHPYPVAMAECEAHPERFHGAFLESGVTAVFDVGGYPWTRRLGEGTERSTEAPHVLATGPLLATWKPDFDLVDRTQFVLLEDEEGARAAVRSHAAAGSDAIKVWFIVRTPGDLETYAPLVRAVGDEARAVGLPLVVHATSLESARIAVGAGARLLVHSVDDAPVDEAFLAALRGQGTAYCPTLTVHDGYLALYRAEVPDELRAQLDHVHPSVRERALATAELPRQVPPGDEGLAARLRARRATMDANLLAVHRAGVPVVLGTDAGNPLTLHGPSVFPELEAMQAAGLAPAEVLVAATSAAAGALGRGDDLGRIAAGYVADLVVLPRDPAEDVAHLRARTHVMRFGRLRPVATSRSSSPRTR